MTKKFGQILWPLMGAALLMAAWQIAALLVGAEYILPGPYAVFRAICGNIPLLLRHSVYTLQEAIYGLVIAVIFAAALTALLTLSPRLKSMLYPLLLASQMIPIIVIAPLFVIWFGFGLLPKVLVVILVCFFPIVISMLSGLAAADAETIAFYRCMGMNGWQLFRLVRWPMALPYFFGGLRIAVTYSVMGAVIGEWLGAAGGLGLLLTRSKNTYNLPLTFAVIIMIVFWSALLFGSMKFAEYKALSWRRQVDEENWAS
ncbi:MAG: ABC transporter permease [Clostridiales bacterium]|nr:ABC transporter permease [Clostridiales bacterium]